MGEDNGDFKSDIKLKHDEIDELEVKYSNIRSLTAWGILAVSVIAIISSIYHLYVAYAGMPSYQFHLTMHLMFMMVLAFFIYPISSKVLSGKKGTDKIPIYDLVIAAVAIFVCMYWIVNYVTLTQSIGAMTTTDYLVGGIGVLLVLEGTRRTVGPALSVIAMIFIAYAYFGNYMPGFLQHKGFSIERIISNLWYTDSGIFGVPLMVSAQYVIVFILFGAFLKYSGAGEFFISLAYALTGWRKGGPAKTAVLASGFFGMISGSSIANAVTVGSFTIPLMKKAGYRKEFAGAVEASASTGGQIMPPVMGAAAFLMVEYTHIPYNQIIVSAAIPAIAFFFGLWVMAHLEAGKSNLPSVPRSQLPDAWKLFKEKGYMFISVLLLLYLIIFAQLSVELAGFYSIISIVLISWVRKDTRMGIKQLRAALEEGTKGSVGVALACACAGIISGVATLTGLGATIASAVGSLSMGLGGYFVWLFGSLPVASLFVALVVTMIACLILGMGLPTTATYVVLVVLAVPAIVKFNLPSGAMIPLMAVHMFVLYYGVIADITPPVALAAYAASGIAKSNQFWTGVEAFKISLNKLLVPFAFVFSPAILLLGINFNDPMSIASAAFDIVTIFIGIICLQISLSGYFITNCTRVERLFMFAAALALIYPNFWGAVFGVACLGIVYFLNVSRIKSGTTVELTPFLAIRR